MDASRPSRHIPIVDFHSCGIDKSNVNSHDCKQIGKLIYDAFATVGFVYLKNAGITREQVDKVNSITAKFFCLDSAIKQRYAKDAKNNGYVGIGIERINPERPGDYKEAFNVSGPAIIAEKTVWPDDYVENFSSEMKRFCEICRRLSERILNVLSQGMEIKNHELFIESHSKMNMEDNFTTLRALYYPPITSDVQAGQVRLGEHSDYGSFTLLFQDYVGGLQVRTQGGEYVDATPIPDTVIVNIGDILQFWTEGRLKSTKHRVMLPNSAQNIGRRSLAYFVHPNHDVLLSGIQYGIHSERAELKREEPVTAFEYAMKKFENSYT